MSETETETVETQDAPDAPPPPDGGDAHEEEEADQTARQAAAKEGSDLVLKKADRANRDYMKKLDVILGEDPTRHECPTCNGLGVTWGDVEALPELKDAEDTEPCPHCNALGIVKTGALNPEQATMPCRKCGGRGWIEKVLPLQPVAQLPNVPQAHDQVLQGQYIPGKGFVPYGSEEALPGTAGV